MGMSRVGLLALLAVGLTGCAGTRGAQMREMQTQMAHLEGRVRVIEQQTGFVESKAWNQREDVAYLRGRVEGLQTGVGAPGKAASIKPSKKQIQLALKNAGFDPGPIDGKLGSRTRQAVREFQDVNGLHVDGVVGKRTWAKLAPFLDLEASDDKAWAARPAK